MNTEQQVAFDLIVQGKSIFLTGIAGSGKSYLIREIAKWAHENNIRIGITSSTGASATLIGGRTLHSFLGIGLGTKDAQSLAKSVRYRNQFAYEKVKTLDILLIDEISMIDAELFDKISEYIGIIRNKTQYPFGMLQLIFSGDFCQLPPIKGQYCFESAIWQHMRLNNIILTQQMRHNDDDEFRMMLSELRFGRCTDEIYERLCELKHTVFEGDIKPTTLYCKNIDVDAMNLAEYNNLIEAGALSTIYTSEYVDSIKNKKWIETNKYPEYVSLCIGAQVILTINLDQDMGLVNGSRGIVIDLTIYGPMVRFVDGTEIVIKKFAFTSEDDGSLSIKCIPLKLAWSITIHRAQGMTIDRVLLGNLNSFTNGQGYVALSRAKNLKSIKILDVKKSSFRCSKKVIEFYENIV